MLNISNSFKRQLDYNDRNYICYADITLEDGTSFTIANNRIWSSGFSIDDAVSDDNSFAALGSAIINSGSITIDNTDEQYSDYDFTNARVIIRVGLVIDVITSPTPLHVPEIIKKGTFRVDDTHYYDGTITLDLLDYMEYFDRPYDTNLAYPATLDAIVRDACTKCRVTLATSSLLFPHRDYVVNQKPDADSTTFRDVLSYAAQIAGCFARCNVDGQLELKWFETDYIERWNQGYDGGTFNPWNTGDILNGGTFNPWNTGDIADDGTFTEDYHLHIISGLFSQDICVDDVVITQIKILVEIDDETASRITREFSVGTEGYTVEIDRNPFITVDTAPTILGWLRDLLIGLKFRKMTVTTLNNPSIEAGDVAIVYDRKGNAYQILITRTEFAVTGTQTIVCGAETPSRSSATRYDSTVKNYVALRKAIQRDRTAWEAAEDELSQRIASANGLYTTDVITPSSATIHYLHNKPALNESAIRIMISDVGVTMTANGLDEHPTWYGLTVDGNLITAILNTIGINADWINSGSIVIKDENDNETFYADTETGIVRIKANSFSLSGNTIEQIARTTMAGMQYAQCNDSPEIVNKTTSGPANFSLVPGAKITVRFTQRNAASNPTLNIAGTGAKPIYARNTSRALTNITAKDYWVGNAFVDFVYNSSLDTSGAWVIQAEEQNEIFNRLTNGLSNQGIYLSSGNLYINASMINTGTMSANRIYGGLLTLGGSNNGNGRMRVLNSSDTEIGTWNNSGLTVSSTNRKAALTNGGLNFYSGDNATAYWRGSTWGNSRGMTMRNNADYLVFSNSDTLSVNNSSLILNNGLNPEGYQDGCIAYDLRVGHFLFLGVNNDIFWRDTSGSITNTPGFGYHTDGNFYLQHASLDIPNGNLRVTGTKSRIVDTDNYGKVEMYAFETPNCHFADVGSATVGDSGDIYVYFDPVFAETIDAKSNYQVLITRTSQKETEWVEKMPGYFIVHGEPGATFDWMIIGYQRDYVSTRMERTVIDNKVNEDGQPLYNDNESDFNNVRDSAENDDSDEVTMGILNNMISQYEAEVDLL